MRLRLRWLTPTRWLARAMLCGAMLLLSGCDQATAPAPVAANSPPPPPPPPPAPMAAPVTSNPVPMPAAQSQTGTAATATSPVETATPGADEFADARSLFDNHGCKRCHSLDPNAGPPDFAGGPPPGGPPPGGPGGPGGFGGPGGPPRGPSLAHVGANPEHTAEWIAAHIRDPKAHNPRSRMPGFADKMSAEEIDRLAQFLASLK